MLRERFGGVDEVFHLAGKLGTAELDDTPTAAVEVNVLGSINVFEAAVSTGVSRVFHASKPNVWLNTYSITKHAAEKFAEMYDKAEACDTLFRSLRYFNAYGPRQARGPVRKLMPTFVAQALPTYRSRSTAMDNRSSTSSTSTTSLGSPLTTCRHLARPWERRPIVGGVCR